MLSGRLRRESERLEFALPGSPPHLHFHFEVVRLYDIPTDLLADDPALAQLAPLGSGFDSARAEIVQKAASTIRQDTSSERVERLGLLSLLARAKGLPRAATRAIIQLEEIRMGYSYQEILEEGFEKGRAEGLAEGRSEAYRMVRRAVRVRFGEVTDLTHRLSTCSADDLEWLIGQVFSSDSAEAFQAAITQRLGAEG